MLISRETNKRRIQTSNAKWWLAARRPPALTSPVPSLPDLDGIVTASTCKLALWGDAEGMNTATVTGEGDETLSRYQAINTYTNL